MFWENTSELTLFAFRTMVYVEGEASFSNYEDAEGNKKQSLNIVQREYQLLDDDLAY
jgi:hypothetical protein